MNSDAGIAQDAGAPQDAGDDAGSAQDAGNSLDAGAPQDAGIDGGGICAFGRLFVGDVAITTPQDWANFVQGNYACVSGELSIRAPSSVVDGGAQLRALLPPATALRSVGALTMNGSDLETAELASLTFVAGNMTISGNRLTSLNLPALTNVSGRADLQANLTDLEFPALETVAGGLSVGGSLESLELPLLKNGGVEVSSTLITALDLPELLAAPQGLVVAGNQRLSRLTAPKLATSGAMTIVDGLSTVGFPELIEVDGNVRIGAGSLTSLDCPLLTTVDGHLDLFGSRSLATLSLPELTTVTGWISVFDSRLSAFSVPKLTNSERIDLRTNHLMQTVDLPALVDAELVIGFNGALVALNVPSLTSSGLVNVYNESALTTVQFPALSTVFR